MTQLTVGEEVLYRQIHPAFYDDGQLLSPAFKPSSDDEGMMSVDRSSLTSAQAAHEHYTVHNKRSSSCVCGVSVEEFAADAILCHGDPIAETDALKGNPAHGLANYTTIEEKKWKNVAKKLKNLAKKRGICFTP